MECMVAEFVGSGNKKHLKFRKRDVDIKMHEDREEFVCKTCPLTSYPECKEICNKHN